MARDHQGRRLARVIAASLALGAAACGRSEPAPSYSAEEVAAFDAALARTRAATATLRQADIISADGPTATTVGQLFYEIYDALGDLIEARAGDDAFDAAATQIQGDAGDRTGLAVRTYQRAELAASVEAFFEAFDAFAAAHLPAAAGADGATDADTASE